MDQTGDQTQKYYVGFTGNTLSLLMTPATSDLGQLTLTLSPDGSLLTLNEFGPGETIVFTQESSGTSAPLPPSDSGQAIPWNEALSHVGEVTTIEGPVVEVLTDETDSGLSTYLNVGAPYSDPGRFVVVIWGSSRSAFPSAPESMYTGKQIRVTGEVTEYEGNAQIEVASPDAIEIVQ